MNQLPKGWMWVKLGEVFHTTSGGTPSRRETRYYTGDIPWVKSGELDRGLITDTEEKITEEAVRNSSAKIFPKGTLLIALYGATIGKLAFLGVDAATNQAICGIYKSENINSLFLYHYLFYKKRELVSQGIGGAQPNISQTIIKNLGLPLPPKSTQTAIVSKIEELFSELDKGIENLHNSELQLKVYRQSVLNWAYQGRLTNETVKKGAIPDGWNWVKMEDAVNNFDGKRVPLSREVRAKRKGNYRYYGATEIVDYIDDYIFDGEYLLIGEDGANLLSKSRALAFIAEGKFWVNNHAHVLQAKANGLNKYICYYFNSLNLAQYVTGSAQPKLTQANLNKIEIPYCTLEEQLKIVNIIESRFSVIDKLEENIIQNIQKAEVLRQSILKEAFEGTLCEQLLDDEPVYKLLQRTKKEKEDLIRAENERKKNENLLYKNSKEMSEQLKSILEILTASNEPVSSKNLWESSIHKDDIDAFYAQLKKHIESGDIKELPRNGKESFLILSYTK